MIYRRLKTEESIEFNYFSDEFKSLLFPRVIYDSYKYYEIGGVQSVDDKMILAHYIATLIGNIKNGEYFDTRSNKFRGKPTIDIYGDLSWYVVMFVNDFWTINSPNGENFKLKNPDDVYKYFLKLSKYE